MTRELTRCPICDGGRPAVSLRGVRGSLTIVRCPDCTVEILWPQPDQAELARTYGASYYEAWGMAAGESPEVAEMKKATFRRVIARVRTEVSGGRLLDVGTASGFLMEVAAEAGFDPYGVEVSEYSGGIAAGKFGRDRVHIGALETAPFEKGSFAVATLTDLLEHLLSPAETLRRIVDLLAPHGVVLVTTPDTGSWTRLLMRSTWPHYKAEHLFYFNRRSMVVLAGRCGLEVIRTMPAVKALTLGYLRTQMRAYPHAWLTPAIDLASALPSFLADRRLWLTAGEFVALLRVGRAEPTSRGTGPAERSRGSGVATPPGR